MGVAVDLAEKKLWRLGFFFGPTKTSNWSQLLMLFVVFYCFKCEWWDGYVVGKTCNQKVQGQGSSENSGVLVVEPSTFELSAMGSVLRVFCGHVLIENIQQEMTEVA